MACTFLSVMGVATAEGADKGGSIFDDYPAPMKTASFSPSTMWYGGMTGGHVTDTLSSNWFDHRKDKGWEYGGYVGVLRRFERPFALGLEADYTRTSLKFSDHCEDDIRVRWKATARVVAGLFVTDRVMPFLTAGYAWSDVGDPGPVYGGGVVFRVRPYTLVKLEALRHEFDGGPFEKHRDNTARVGISYQLN